MSADQSPTTKARPKVYSLREMASKLDPQAFGEWEAAKVAATSRMLRGDYTSKAIDVNPRGALIVGQHVGSECALSKLQHCIKDAIASGEYAARGTCPLGVREVSRLVADQLWINLDAGVVAHPGGMTWSGVTMWRVKKPLLDQATLNNWMRKRFETWPVNKTPPHRDDDQWDAELHFAPLGYRFRGLDKMIRAARKAEAKAWTTPGSKDRKIKAWTESKGRKIERRSA
jgi:hypothetical protein